MTIPLPGPRTWSVGDLATAAVLNLEIRDAVNYLTAPPFFVARQTVAQSIANNPAPFTPITFTTEDVDTYNGHSTSSNTSRYVAQIAGWYRVLGMVTWVSNATGRRLAQLMVNSVAQRQHECLVVAAAAGNTMNLVEGDLYLNVGDYVEVAAFQGSGAALNTYVAFTQTDSILCALWTHT